MRMVFSGVAPMESGGGAVTSESCWEREQQDTHLPSCSGQSSREASVNVEVTYTMSGHICVGVKLGD